jgi:mono/diheme cytochrome c family protein
LRRTVIERLLGLLASTLVLGCPAPESPATAYARDPASVARGRSLFVGACAAYCHGLRPGHRDAPYLFDCDWKHGERDEDHFRVIRDGVPDTRMPSFADKLPEGEEDIWKLVAFLKTESTCRLKRE